MAAKKGTKKPGTAQTDAEKDWTVMVYLAGDNNLTVESLYSLTEMKRVDQGDRINIIAQLDPQDDYLPTRRYQITQSTAQGHLLDDHLDKAPFQESAQAVRRKKAREKAMAAAREAIEKEAQTALGSGIFAASLKPTIVNNMGLQLLDAPTDPTSSTAETNTGSPETLYNFISYCLEKFSAKHYMVVLSGHGSGTEQDFLMKDDSQRDSLTIQELRQVFEDLGQPIDILGFNSCLMSMAEVCYELKGKVKIMVGSESYSPTSGWPLHQVLRRLVNETKKKAKQDDAPMLERVAKGIVEEYVNFYADYSLGGVSVDQSALNVEKAGELKILTDALADALTAELNDPDASTNIRKALVLAHWKTQSYNGEIFADLADFCDCLKEHYPVKTISDLCTDLADFIRTSFVLQSCFSGPAYQFSYGVSIYFPWSRVAPDYKQLSFAQSSRDFNDYTDDSAWVNFLETYTSKTRRLPRNVSPELDAESFASSFILQRSRRTIDLGSGNPIVSMRNPPIVALPTPCIRAHASIKKLIMEEIETDAINLAKKLYVKQSQK